MTSDGGDGKAARKGAPASVSSKAIRAVKGENRGGEHLNALNDFAKAYLDHYQDLDHDGHGPQRLEEWHGDEFVIHEWTRNAKHLSLKPFL
jgi:hypothetical protein